MAITLLSGKEHRDGKEIGNSKNAENEKIVDEEIDNKKVESEKVEIEKQEIQIDDRRKQRKRTSLHQKAPCLGMTWGRGTVSRQGMTWCRGMVSRHGLARGLKHHVMA